MNSGDDRAHPWLGIELDVYERRHMSDEQVGQLQRLHVITGEQLAAYPTRAIGVLGIAGGNGLDLIGRGAASHRHARDAVAAVGRRLPRGGRLTYAGGSFLPRCAATVRGETAVLVMTEFETIRLKPVDSLTITILVDNVSDLLLLDEGPAIRPPIDSRAPRVQSAVLEGGQTLDVLRAEHGFAALVTVARAGREHRVLFDTGISPDGLIENMRRLQLAPQDIEVIVLSHGHFDHTSGIDGLIRALGRTSLPVLIHPAFWSRRRLALPGREPVVLPATSRSALAGAGFEIIEEQQPSFLFAGSLLVTGEVDRTSEFERGFAIHQACRGGEWQPDPLILDDQALVANVAGKGLVALTACGHAGVVNTVRYAQRRTGIERVHAIVGGFHLNGPLFEPLIGPTCDAFAGFDPDYLVPAHCTGWRAIHALAARFPRAYLQNSVGTRFEFAAADRPATA